MASKRVSRKTMDDNTIEMAKVLAMCVRTAIEDLHSTGAITDATMAELNPLVRNAIATGLHAIHLQAEWHPAFNYIRFMQSQIPDYWESPELLDDLIV